MKRFSRRTGFWVVAVAVVLVVVLAANAGKMLVIDDPKPSDVIVVLAGETDHRPTHALELLEQGYARRVLIDVPAEAKIYDSTPIQFEVCPRLRRSGSARLWGFRPEMNPTTCNSA
jgi:cellulose synthase/poly-beta-1,6-N-acetylglucosamine synthase-like glycosyltransferase